MKPNLGPRVVPNTGCRAGLEDLKEPAKRPGLMAAGAGVPAGALMGRPLPLKPAGLAPPKALPFLSAEGPTAPPPQAGTNQGQLHIRLASSKAKPKGHLNS